jgi:tRNA-dihydrouridine synthase B
MNTLETAQQQLAAVANFLDGLANQMDRLPITRAQPLVETSE